MCAAAATDSTSAPKVYRSCIFGRKYGTAESISRQQSTTLSSLSLSLFQQTSTQYASITAKPMHIASVPNIRKAYCPITSLGRRCQTFVPFMEMKLYLPACEE